MYQDVTLVYVVKIRNVVSGVAVMPKKISRINERDKEGYLSVWNPAALSFSVPDSEWDQRLDALAKPLNQNSVNDAGVIATALDKLLHDGTLVIAKTGKQPNPGLKYIASRLNTLQQARSSAPSPVTQTIMLYDELNGSNFYALKSSTSSAVTAIALRQGTGLEDITVHRGVGPEISLPFYKEVKRHFVRALYSEEKPIAQQLGDAIKKNAPDAKLYKEELNPEEARQAEALKEEAKKQAKAQKIEEENAKSGTQKIDDFFKKITTQRHTPEEQVVSNHNATANLSGNSSASGSQKQKSKPKKSLPLVKGQQTIMTSFAVASQQQEKAKLTVASMSPGRKSALMAAAQAEGNEHSPELTASRILSQNYAAEEQAAQQSDPSNTNNDNNDDDENESNQTAATSKVLIMSIPAPTAMPNSPTHRRALQPRYTAAAGPGAARDLNFEADAKPPASVLGKRENSEGAQTSPTAKRNCR